MRNVFIAASLLLLGACGRSEETPQEQSTAAESRTPAAATVTFAGSGRNRLCLDEGRGRAAFITYGQGNANCTATGSLRRNGSSAALFPDGDQACRVDLTISGEGVRLGGATAACAYYCGPTASYSGAEFRRSDSAGAVVDLAGDPLC
ncbi:hypothetical protein [Sphingomonas arenae]|uniref:hypothetical protein n=1 Tax=Sphingomonas arenae TaxID=2812555 RepID=UPI00196850C6|nr:hypothetical protein [Sphingomonas arenae]